MKCYKKFSICMSLTNFGSLMSKMQYIFFRLSVCLCQTLFYISITIADIIMQLFAFYTTLRCADYYIKISS
ncbi:hypothetical protein O3M35_000622 [Rhynocoris fuscipes]|uniref:Uncharacterized protein n=1 Tax=Rhynocoris fuscipes TaxID=488301 RepID=A0AAW1DN81_9HEMI